MLNKPKHSIIKNFNYSWSGLKATFKEERFFRYGTISTLIIAVGLIFIPNDLIPLGYKLLLFGSLFVPLIAELFNSSIERVVDMYTKDFHPLAKFAKDTASAGVLLSFLLTAFVWISSLVVLFL